MKIKEVIKKYETEIERLEKIQQPPTLYEKKRKYLHEVTGEQLRVTYIEQDLKNDLWRLIESLTQNASEKRKIIEIDKVFSMLVLIFGKELLE